MKLRLLLFTILIVLSGSILSAQDTVTVEIYFPIAVDSPISEILDGYASAYMEENPDVEIVWSFEGGYGDVKNRLLTVAEGGGDLPALAIMLATDIYDLRNAEVIQSLDMYVSDEYLNDFIPAWLTNSYYDFDGDGEGELYGIPFQRSTVLLYRNVSLFEEAGLDAPSSWEELALAAQALTTDSREGILIPNSWPYWLFQPFAAGSGQNIVSESDTEVIFNSSDSIEALEFWVDLYEEYDATPDGVQSNWGDAPGAFADGSAAMILHSSGSLRSILDMAEFEVGVSGIPGQEGGEFTVTGGGNLYLVAGIDDATAQAAWEFTEWLTAPEQSVDWSMNAGYFNTRASGFELEEWQDYANDNPQIADAQGTIEFAVREFSVQSLGDVRNILHTGILGVLNGETDAASAMEEAQLQADEILSIFR